MTIVQFGSSARVTARGLYITSAPDSLHFGSGGTNFLPALQMADSVMNCVSGTPILIFMSDGGSSEGAPSCAAAVRNLKSKYSNLQVHMIAFSGGANTAQLRDMASAGNGQLHVATVGAELISTFSAIAGSNDSALRELATKVGASLSNQIRDKIIVDYL